jgi:SpoVK/Ycf46/Vps4 family AAA+-type ATPase
MLPNDRVQSAERETPSMLARISQAASRGPLWRRITAIVVGVCFCWLIVPVLAIAAIVKGWRGRAAWILVACGWVEIFAIIAGASHVTLRSSPGSGVAIVVLPFAVGLAANAGPLARRFVPCRTMAWALLWPIPLAIALMHAWPAQLEVGVVAAWLLAAALLGWRTAKALQDERMYGSGGQVFGPGAANMAPRGAPRGGYNGAAAGGGNAGGRPAGHAGQYGARAAGAAQVYADHAAREQTATAARPRPQISVEDAMAELDAMIGLGPVKEQVRSIAASIEAARRRAVAGLSNDKPMRHFVFLGPPGTGKTTVARVIAKIFYAFGLLDMPEVVEAQRSDLVGEYLGATAIKTNELIDSALGGVLFIDEAYSLVNEGDGQADRFGMEAVQTLLKRAEDNREDLIIILAGYEKQTESFLASNPGLASRFATRVRFPSYSPSELLALAESQILSHGEALAPDAGQALRQMLDEVARRRITDELGNGRFVRTLLEKAGQARDVRVMSAGGEPGRTELTTIYAADLNKAFAELTSRLRGYEETPTPESALAELNLLVGLDPVKDQVRAIAAQLGVARLRAQQGLTSQPPARHFVFTGPPGTGKTTVARILGRIFAAQGLLVRPEVVEAHRADLVGEHLGSTAIKTNKLVDSALGGVLFIDEAYSLHNDGYAGGDAYGAEAVQTLLKRAEDDRDRLVIVLAGYPDDMDRFLRSNPGLGSRFNSRVSFPSYTPADLTSISVLLAEQAGDVFEPAALDTLGEIFERACTSGRIDELGNGRFARSLFERACARRDLRVVRLGESATAEDLTTLTAADVKTAYEELAQHGSA